MRPLSHCLTIALAALPFSFAAARVNQNIDTTNWTAEFNVEHGELVSSGRNPWFILEPGYQLVLEGGDEHLIITVLPETRMVDGVETRVVEERESKGANLVEVSRNFFAISRKTNSVYYFGEEVDVYKNGKITDHEGAWLAGVSGARFGLMMPGVPLLKARHYQEIAPKVALDRAEIAAMNETIRTPAGTFNNVLRVNETTPLEPLAREAKYYARNVGLLQEGSLKLVRYGQAGSTVALK